MEINEHTIINYIQTHTKLFDDTADLSAKEFGDGNINFIFRIEDNHSGKSVIVKHALPYPRLMGESWPLTIDRQRIEAEAIRTQQAICPAYLPAILHYDEQHHLIIMEDLKTYAILRGECIKKKRFANFAKHISQYMAETLFYTSDLYLDQSLKKQQQKQFVNPELCKITEDLFFTTPYKEDDSNVIPNALAAFVKRELQTNSDVLLAVAKLKYQFLTKAEALLHGDLHTGSIFVNTEQTKVIDQEFAFYGPIGFDVGSLLANIWINYYTHVDDQAYQSYLLTLNEDIWHLFAKHWLTLMTTQTQDDVFKAPGFQQSFLRTIFEDCIGFAGTEMIRRTIGLAQIEDLKDLSTHPRIDEIKYNILQTAIYLLTNGSQCQNIQTITHHISQQQLNTSDIS